jgi:DNA-binding MarR family transcriptional regulator
MGITRQSVQRTADLLAEQGLVTFRDNPAHRRAKLVDITEAGLSAVRLINPGHSEMARRLSEIIDETTWAAALSGLQELSDALHRLDRL